MTATMHELPVYGEYDAIVSGGGLTGTVCAVELARSGMKVALVERRSALGWEIGRARRVFADLSARTSPYVSDLWEKCRSQSGSGTLRAPYAELALDQWVADAGVDVLFHGWATACHRMDGRTAGLIAGTKEGYVRLQAPLVIETDDHGRLIPAQYERSVEPPCRSRSFLLGGAEPASEASDESAIADGGASLRVRPLPYGQAQVDVTLSSSTAAERETEFYNGIRKWLPLVRSAVPYLSKAKLLLISEEEWCPAAYRLTEPTLYEAAEGQGDIGDIGSLWTKRNGVWSEPGLTRKNIAAEPAGGVLYAGAWLPAYREHTGEDEELAVINRIQLGEAAASFILSRAKARPSAVQ
ncbi:MAG: FAD-dependent pyridine nucleotide-disulfide oxidoreductase [Paenibacillus sp.]|nr:FAD-dependent pyridine nucleotide-disulfide oxidoreductase [Paenibacillus sp.]